MGAVWALLNPISMILVYTVVFSQVMRMRLVGADGPFAYSIYLCAGLLTWTLFAEISGRSVTMFIDNATLLKKMSFPRLCLPVSIAASSLVNFGIVFSLFTLFMVLTGTFPGLVFLGLVPLLLIHVALAVGVGVILGLLNVFFRDIGQFYGIVLQFWLWLTPIVYPIDILPTFFQQVVRLNPLTHLAVAYQTILLRGQWPEWGPILWLAVGALALCAFSLRLFKKRSGEMVDEL